MERYKVSIYHGEGVGMTVYHVVDTAAPEDEQPCVVLSYLLKEEPNAKFLVEDFCRRHNTKESNGV